MNSKVRGQQVHLPMLLLIIGLIGVLFFSLFLVLMIIFPNNTASWWCAVIFVTGILLGLAFVIAYINCRIDIGENSFKYSTFFGKKYVVPYSSIVGVKITESIIHVHTETKHFYIEPIAVGLEVLLNRIHDAHTTI